MKILAIRIKNLASLEGTTEIDFTQEPLRSAGIFAITGPTGSGKSTILDALCLALYAKTPRYVQARETGIEVADVRGSTISQGDVRAILRDGATDGFAEVDFVGVDGQHYRANWSVRRARNKAEGSLQQANTTLKNLSAHNDIGGKKTELLPEITRLVGLTYDQFTRSVLLAQGDFTAFLKADKDQKASLLEKLTGTHIYSALSKKVFERHRDEHQQLKVFQQSSEGIPTLTAEELEALKHQEVALTNVLQTVDAKITATAKEIEWYETLQTHLDRVAQAQEVLAAARTEQAQAEGRAQYLKQVEHVQPTRTWVDARSEAAEQLAQRRQELEDATARQQHLLRQVDETQARLSEATQRLEADTTQQEAAKPLLDEARKLDIQLQAKAEEVTAAQQALEMRKAKQGAAQQRLTRAEHEAEALLQQIAKFQHWKAKHEERKPVAENRTFIVTKLAEARKQLDAVAKAAREATQCVADVGTKEREYDQLAKQAAQLDQTVTEGNTLLGTLLRRLAAISVVQLREESTALTTELDTLLVATAQWRQVYQAETAGQALREKSASAKQTLVEKEAQLATAHAALQASAEQRKASAIMLEKATLAASENVEDLRRQLVTGQPCPVCGSDNHPYAHENRQLNHVLHELKQAHEALEKTYGEQLGIHSQLVQAVPLLQRGIAEVEEQAERNQLALDGYINVWESYAVSRSCAAVAPEQKEHWLADCVAAIRKKQEIVAEQLANHEQLHAQAEATRQQLSTQQTQYTSTANAVKDIERGIQTLKERLTIAQSEQSEYAADLKETLAALQPNFPDGQWVTNWKSQSAEFIASINAFADEWQATLTKLDQAVQQHQVAKATLAGIRAEQQSMESDTGQAEQELAAKQTSFASLRQARQSIFDGEAVAAVEARLKRQHQDAQEQLTAQQQQQSELKDQQANVLATMSQTKVEAARLEKRKTEQAERVAQWLSDYQAKQGVDLDDDTLQTLLGYPSEWITEERMALAAIDRALTQSTSVLDERKRQLIQHEQLRLSDQPLEMLREAAQTLQTTRFESQRDHNEIGYKLKQDEANKQQLGDLLGAIQAQAAVVDNWAKLNEIIGSADGKKFRQVAQEYTLDVLLSYANVHLEVLTQRYRLQRIPNTLGLQVLDQDMGDEVRTVYSLSGGESFLVSLALALGLASLSANRMQVESLFIDEGFGSLDPHTLNIAMDALERLHNQGRKVGVISHVQEMTERIPVQIKVSKQQSGRSEVEVC